MKGTLDRISCGGREIPVYLPPSYGKEGPAYPLVCASGDMEPEELDAIFREFEKRCAALECCECVFAAVPSPNPEEEYSPWPAPPAFKGSGAFSGGGEAYLRYLVNELRPALIREYRVIPDCGFLMGYSLSGLHTLWAAYTDGSFQGYASLSGSLWFDGWLEFAETHTPRNPSAQMFLSLGSSEEKSRSQRLSKVGDHTRETFRLLQGQLDSPESCTLQWNPGGHFNGIPERFARALAWLLRPVAG